MITYKIIDQNTQDFTYLDEICELMDRISADNAAPHLYPPDREFFEKTCKKTFLTVLAFNDNKLVGYSVVKFLEKWPGYLGNVDGYEVKQSVMFHFIIVDSACRGQKVGHTLNQLSIDEIKKTDKKHAFTTIHPDNIANIKNAEKLGFIEIEKRELFEEKLIRSLMYMNI